MFSFKKLWNRLFPASNTTAAVSGRLSLQQLEVRELPATLLWLGGTGGGGIGNGALAQDWGAAGNWEVKAVENVAADAMLVVGQKSDRAPMTHDIVRFTADSTTSCLINADAEVARLEIDGLAPTLNVNPNHGTLTIHGGLLNTRTLLATQYAIGGEKELILASGTFTWKSGTMATHRLGRTEVKAGAILSIESSNVGTWDARLAGRSLFIHPPANNLAGGRVNFTSGSLYFQKDPLTPNQPGQDPTIPELKNFGTFSISGTATGFTSANSGDGKFWNHAAFKVDLAQGTPAFTSTINFLNLAPADAAGNGVTITKGELILTGLENNLNGGASIAAGQKLILRKTGAARPSLILNDNSQFTGDGTVRAEGADLRLDNTSKAAFATLVLSDSAAIKLYSVLRPGIQPTVTIHTLIWLSGTISDALTVKIPESGGAFISQGPGATNPRLTKATIENRGLVLIGASAYGGGPVTLFVWSGGTISNIGTGTTAIVDESNILGFEDDRTGAIKVSDRGKFLKTENSGLSNLDVTITSTNGEAPILSPGSGYRKHLGNNNFDEIIKPPVNPPEPPKKAGFRGNNILGPNNPLGVAVDGELFGTVAITTATFTNAGTIRPGDTGAAGAVSFVGNLTQTATGVLAAEIGGAAGAVAGIDYDQLVVAAGGNQLSLAGALHLTVLNTLTAPVGTVFGLIDNKSSLAVSGTFAGLAQGAQFSVGGWTFAISYAAKLDANDAYSNDVILTVVATPATSTHTASVAGFVWIDEDEDGVRDTGEAPAVGVAVELIDANTGHALRTLTDTNGAYIFPTLPAGDYKVRFDHTTNATYAGYRFTTTNADSLALPATGTTAPFALAAAQALSNVRAGLVANAAPVGTDDEYTVTRDDDLEVLTGGVLVYDTDAENDALTAMLVDGPEHGTLTLNANGTFEYTPDAGFVGLDGFSYRPVDAFGPGEVTYVAITVETNPPVATNDTATTNEDTAVEVAVLGNDSDPDSDDLAILWATDGDYGTVAIDDNGTATDFTDDVLVYTPFGNWNGTDTFTYWVIDAAGGVSSATATVTVAPVNDAPVADDGWVMTPQGTFVDVDLRALVSDVETAPANFTFAVSNAVNGTVALLGNGYTARFTPNTGYHGAATFTYTATDTGDGASAALSDTGVVTVSANTAPTAADMTATIHAGGTMTFYPAWMDPDGDFVTVTSFTQGAHGTVAAGPGGFGLVYTATSQTYTGTDTFTYTIDDGHGGTSTGTVTVTLSNTAPTANNTTISVHAGGSTTAYPIYFDMDGDTVTVVGYTQGQHGTVSTGMMGMGLVYTATSQTYTGTDSFTYTVDDGHGGTATGTITVLLTNTPPTAYNASASTSVNTPVTVYPMYSDMDGDTVTVASFTQPAYGSVTLGSGGFGFLYTPPTGWTGTVTFTYTVDDGHGGTATATVTITVS